MSVRVSPCVLRHGFESPLRSTVNVAVVELDVDELRCDRLAQLALRTFDADGALGDRNVNAGGNRDRQLSYA